MRSSPGASKSGTPSIKVVMVCTQPRNQSPAHYIQGHIWHSAALNAAVISVGRIAGFPERTNVATKLRASLNQPGEEQLHRSTVL